MTSRYKSNKKDKVHVDLLSDIRKRQVASSGLDEDSKGDGRGEAPDTFVFLDGTVDERVNAFKSAIRAFAKAVQKPDKSVTAPIAASQARDVVNSEDVVAMEVDALVDGPSERSGAHATPAGMQTEMLVAKLTSLMELGIFQGSESDDGSAARMLESTNAMLIAAKYWQITLDDLQASPTVVKRLKAAGKLKVDEGHPLSFLITEVATAATLVVEAWKLLLGA
jgi:hypothetical protein